MLILLSFFKCKKEPNNNTFTYNKTGYWWQLLSFNSDTFIYKPNHITWINACFKTQNDSVFYDSEHDLGDRFFIKTDTSETENCIKHLVSHASVDDSICALIKTEALFKQQFKSEVPFFCIEDSVVKIYLKVKAVLTGEEYKALTEKTVNNEMKQIESFYSSIKKYEAARDPMGFYWIEKPTESNSPKIKYGEAIRINYLGSFLNGRTVDSSPPNFQINYGTPDQLLKGLNYVISKLKIGQTSKIILPSHLAFGENGSSNGSIPPYTPMLYTISIIDPKNNK